LRDDMKKIWFVFAVALMAAGFAWAQAPATQAQSPATQAQSPATQAPPVETQPQQPPPAPMVLNLPGASLTEVIDLLARRLKLNYILDPRVKGGNITLQTYGEIKGVNVRELLDLILRINGAAMIQVGDIHRIVPLADVSRLPITPMRDGANLTDDERILLNMVFVKYVNAAELTKLLEPFIGDGGKVISYEPANLLIIQDSGRNMRRTMELIAQFDSDTLANQRVRLFDVKHGRPSELAKDIETVLKGIALTEKTGAVKFVPLDRLNTLIGVAPNPGVFAEVQKWLDRFDIPAKAPVGATQNFAYRVKYGQAMVLSYAVQALYSGNPYLIMMLGQMQQMMSMSRGGGGGMYGGGMGMMGGGMMGGGMMGGMYGGGMYGGGMMGGMMPGMMGGMMMPGMMGMGGMMPGMMGMPGMMMPGMGMYPGMPGYGAPQPGASGGPMTGGAQANATGSYAGADPMSMFGGGGKGPRIVPNPFDNTLLIQSTESEFQQILKLLEKLDVPPRQVLIEARIYEVSLTGAFSAGVQSYLQRQTAASANPTNATSPSRQLLASATGSGVQLTAGLLVGQSRELLSFLVTQENNGRSRVLATPAVIATDNLAASISVGTDVPTLSSQATTGLQQGGTSLFANNIQTRSTGVNFSITPRILPSGVVSLDINQDISSPVPTPAGIPQLQSPSFSRRNVSTSVTVQDGDTVAIGGIIQESDTLASAGIPVLHRIPYLGFVFGGKSTTKQRTELVVFITPRVIYDTADLADASEEIRARLKTLNKMIKE
jgi:general secretion pathway protein D